MRRTFCQTPWTSGLFRAIRRIGCWTMALADACNRMPSFQQGRTNVHAVFGNRCGQSGHTSAPTWAFKRFGARQIVLRRLV